MKPDPKETKRREKDARAAHWKKMMDTARRSGQQKYIEPSENPYLYHSDFDELVEKEKAEHGKAQERAERERRARERMDQQNRARAERREAAKKAKEK